MYIKSSHERIINTCLLVLAFIFSASLNATHSKLLTLFNKAINFFIDADIPSLKIMTKVLNFLGTPVLSWLYVLIIWFLLWGFKHKIFATWCVFTMLIGQVLFYSLQAVILPSNTHFLFTFLTMLFIVAIATTGLTNSDIIKISVKWGCFVFAVILILLRIKNSFDIASSSVITILLAASWAQLSEIIYLTVFDRLQNLTPFHHSDFN